MAMSDVRRHGIVPCVRNSYRTSLRKKVFSFQMIRSGLTDFLLVVLLQVVRCSLANDSRHRTENPMSRKFRAFAQNHPKKQNCSNLGFCGAQRDKSSTLRSNHPERFSITSACTPRSSGIFSVSCSQIELKSLSVSALAALTCSSGLCPSHRTRNPAESCGRPDKNSSACCVNCSLFSSGASP